MRLRTILRSWLGITCLEEAVEKRTINKMMLRKEIADALTVMLSGKNLSQYGHWSEYLGNHGDHFERILRKVADEQVRVAAVSQVDARIGNEAFIDELVTRLRRKQLS